MFVKDEDLSEDVKLWKKWLEQERDHWLREKRSK